MNHRVPKGIRLMICRLLTTPGYSVRQVMRETEAGRDVVLRYRKALYRLGHLPACPCGKEAGHNGWCQWRAANSEARIARLKQMHKYSEFSLKGNDLNKAALRNAELCRAYYKRNAEKIKAQKKAYYAANREKIRERSRKYHHEFRSVTIGGCQ